MDGVERNTVLDGVLPPAPVNAPAAAPAGNAVPSNSPAPNFSANLQSALQQNSPVPVQTHAAIAPQNSAPDNAVQAMIEAIVNAIEAAVEPTAKNQPASDETANLPVSSTQTPANHSATDNAPVAPQLVVTVIAENLPQLPQNQSESKPETAPAADDSQPSPPNPIDTSALAIHLLEAIAATLAATAVTPAQATPPKNVPAADTSTGHAPPPPELVIRLTQPTIQVTAVIQPPAPHKPESPKSDDQSTPIVTPQIITPVLPTPPVALPQLPVTTDIASTTAPAATTVDPLADMLTTQSSRPLSLNGIKSTDRNERTTATSVSAKHGPVPVSGDSLKESTASNPAPQSNDANSIAAPQVGANTPPPVMTPSSHPVDFGTVSPRDPQQLVNRIADAVLQSHDSGRELSVRISPPDLGPVRIEVYSDAGVITARVETQTSAAQQVLTDHLPQLHEALAQRGASIERVDVVRSDTHDVHSHASGEANWSAAGQQPQQNAQDSPRRRPQQPARSRKESAIPAAAIRPDLGLQELNVRV